MSLLPCRGRILCVDDNAQLLQSLALGLERRHFEVVKAAGGAEALIKFHAYHGSFGAVLTDSRMPQMSGLELVQHLRGEHGFKGCVVVMSADLTQEELRAYHDFQVSGFFKKPFDLDLLVSVLLPSLPEDS